jgi:transcriptional regulator with XRE-family HTH domain
MTDQEPSACGTWRTAYLRTMIALRRGRERQRLSQERVAASLGVHMRTLRRWENGEGDPPAQVLFRWAEIVGVSIGANLPHPPGS